MSDYVIGLTGGIGSGKTTVTNIFSKMGIDIIDADIIARDVVQKGRPALSLISEHFGDHFILPNGELNRALLRQQIFSNNDDKSWLNNLLHPLIREEITLQASSSKSPYCIIVAPLLIENGLTSLVNRVLVIDVNESTQLSRTTARDSNSEQQVQAIINSQVSRQVRQAHADDILLNDSCSIEDLTQSVSQLHQQYLLFSARVNKQ
jgi:dephospho-CoA kinase